MQPLHLAKQIVKNKISKFLQNVIEESGDIGKSEGVQWMETVTQWHKEAKRRNLVRTDTELVPQEKDLTIFQITTTDKIHLITTENLFFALKSEPMFKV